MGKLDFMKTAKALADRRAGARHQRRAAEAKAKKLAKEEAKNDGTSR